MSYGRTYLKIQIGPTYLSLTYRPYIRALHILKYQPKLLIKVHEMHAWSWTKNIVISLNVEPQLGHIPAESAVLTSGQTALLTTTVPWAQLPSPGCRHLVEIA
jgi:hypothetical protein